MAILTGIDPGTFSIKVVQGQMAGPLFKLTRAIEIPIEPSDDPEAEILRTLQSELPGLRLKPSPARLGLTGRDLMIRYTAVPPVPLWRLRMLMDFEIQDMSSSSGEPLYADYNLLATAEDDADERVLVGLVKSHFLESRLRALQGVKVPFRSTTPNCLALFNSYLAFGEPAPESTYTLLVDVGDRNLELAIEKDGELVFARNLAGGGDLFTAAIAEAFDVSTEKARGLKDEYGNVTPRGRASYASSAEERVANAIMGVAGQLAGMIQSTLTFARSQRGRPDLRIGRALISGGGAQLKGLDAYLEQNLGVPVGRFAPEAGLDTSALPADEAEVFEADPGAFAVALGLARMSEQSDAFGLDIVTDAIKRKRKFTQRTLYLAMAGVAAALFLGFVWVDLSGKAAKAADAAKKARRDERTEAQRRKGYDQVIEEADRAKARLDALLERSGNGANLLRAERLVQGAAPASMWVRSLTVSRRPVSPPGQETDRKQAVEKSIVVLKGEMEQLGATVTKEFNDFVTALRADATKPHVVVVDAPSGRGGAFEITIDFKGWDQPEQGTDA
ncbi:MAG: pilus assembly protein PilM [Planctomycetota bacterium]